MRRPLPFLLVLALLLFVAAPVGAEEKSDAKSATTPEQVARIILLGGESQQALAAQYLQRADAKTLLAVQRALRRLAPQAASKLAAEKAKPKQPKQPMPEKGPVTLVTVETRILEVKGENPFSDLRVDGDQKGNVLLLDKIEQEVIGRALQKSKRINQLTAPRITVYDGQRANVSVMEQTSYIQDYDVEVKGDTWIADPIIGVVQSGLLVDLRPVASADKEAVTIEIDFTWADVQRPIPERKVILREGGEPVTIQLPQIDIGSASATATIPAGGAALVASPVKLGNGKDAVTRYVMITPKVVTLDAQDLRKMGEELELEKDEPAKRRVRKPAVQPQPDKRRGK